MEALVPKVSFIVPIYNVEKYVCECIHSLVNQTLKDIEIICINDQTKDGSIKNISRFLNDKRIVIIYLLSDFFVF